MLWNWTTAFEDMQTLRREMDHLLERSQNYFTGTSTQSFPLLNIYNQEQSVLVVAEVPGLVREDIDISFVDGTLKLSGERKSVELGEKVAALREERGLGKFEKSIKIPVDIDSDRISAKLNDGLLSIELPKPEKVKPRQISIQ